MSQSRANASPTIGPAKVWLFRVVAVALVCGAGLFLGEWLLRHRQAQIDGSNTMEPGLFRHDPELGWSLQPGWHGSHRHHDFAATYSVNSLGFRADTRWSINPGKNALVLVAGDSFTFGLGVDDHETFVHHLDTRSPGGLGFANLAIPGFSTDQEVLLIEKHLNAFQPDQVLLVVYLGNDVLDNPRAWPLQAAGSKPYFTVVDASLVLNNSPVLLAPRPGADLGGGLAAALFGPDRTSWPLRLRLEQRSELFRLFSQRWPAGGLFSEECINRCAPPLRLFALLTDRLAKMCRQRDTKLTFALLAGQSFVELPGSVSAQYQDHCRRQIVESCATSGVAVIDAAAAMRLRRETDATPWFFPSDGHLNPAGHQVVAEIIADAL